jgi:hypothetical protein
MKRTLGHSAAILILAIAAALLFMALRPAHAQRDVGGYFLLPLGNTYGTHQPPRTYTREAPKPRVIKQRKVRRQ